MQSWTGVELSMVVSSLAGTGDSRASGGTWRRHTELGAELMLVERQYESKKANKPDSRLLVSSSASCEIHS